jgi:hypothetical protein
MENMKMMIELEDGNYVNSRLVRNIFTVKHKDETRTKLSLEGDGEYTTASYAMGSAEEIARQINDKIIKAEPGYKLVMFAADDYYGFDFSIEGEVIAWRIDPQKYGSRKPITISADEDKHPYVILCPDGKIIDQTHTFQSFDNIKAWETTARRNWAERRARHLAKAEGEANREARASVPDSQVSGIFR